MAPKRPHKTLTLAEKQEIVKKLNDGISGKALAEKYRVGTSTISDIKRNKEKIMDYIANCAPTLKRRKVLRKPDYPEMENELYKWFQLQRETHATVTINILREKAIQIYSKYYNDNKFVASRGWLDKFKKRHGIRRLKVVGHKLPSNESAVQPFLREFTEKMNELNLLPSQIYNADESVLFWKLLPNRISSKERTAVGRKTSKERITFLACANGDGTHKVKMMVIGKIKKSRDFKNCANLPVEYYSTKNAWMTPTLFVKWFHESFVLQVKKFQMENNLNGKAILLVDNAACHASEMQLTSDDGKIITMFLQPNCSPLIQPMDQNVIRLTKQYYRKSLLLHVLSLEENNMSGVLRNITLKDAVFLLANSWNKLSPDAIEKCWKNILYHSVNNDSNNVPIKLETKGDSDDISFSILKERLLSVDEDQQEFAEIGNMLQQINADNHRPKKCEIQEWIVGDEDHLPLDSDDSSSGEEVAREELEVKHEEAIRSFSTCIRWAEENRVESNNLTILRLLRLRAMEAKQSAIR